MNIDNKKCVMVIDENLPMGLIANTAAIMGMTFGKQVPKIIGQDILDMDNCVHLGIIEFPVPILKGNQRLIKEIYDQMNESKAEDVLIIDFSTLAQGCKTYDEYIEKMHKTNQDDLKYIGITLYGNKKKINRLTGSLPLLR